MSETTENTLAVKQARILESVRTKIGAKEIDLFATFAKNQIGNRVTAMVGLTETNDILNCLAEIFSAKVIPSGFSLNSLLTQFKSWHSKGGAGIKRLGKVADSVPDKVAEEEDVAVNVSADEAGGETLQKIGLMLDPDRTFTPTAINDILKKLTVKGEGKLEVMRQMIKHYLGTWSEGDKDGIVNFSIAMERVVVQAAGRYVDFIEQAREMDPNGEIATLENLHKLLDANKLRDSMSTADKDAEDLFLTVVLNYANDIEFAADDEWKSVVMEMLAEDLQNSPIFAPREHLNIVKSYQNLVANILKPPPRRGRPPKAK